MKADTAPSGYGEIKILLLPFCLRKREVEDVSAIARSRGYRVVVATTTSFALSEVRKAAVSKKNIPVRIVGVVCDGRAKKVALGLFLLKARQLFKRLALMKTRRIILSRVTIQGGTRSMFGRRDCDIGNNTVPREDLMEALYGGRIFFVL
ncbi:MAG: hypothetical protein GTN70_02445 [Deltaproteobacteria bacterium]|nr:hypothetical protein [Deltaproteobacteria bacterium]NIS76502.1 hypothetical protein [Deltaproteobacteria bacterium]